MKKNFLKKLTLATGILAISLGVLTSVKAQKDDAIDLANENYSIGCYTTHILDCGFGLGQQLICNFTGSYGAPYQCTSHNCYGTIKTRHCVQGV